MRWFPVSFFFFSIRLSHPSCASSSLAHEVAWLDKEEEEREEEEEVDP